MDDSDQFAKSEQVCSSFFRKPVNKMNIRKRTIDHGENDDDDESPKPYACAEPIEEESGKQPVFQFESSKEIQLQHDSKATATLETETEFSKDARAVRERALKQAAKRSNSLKGDGKLLYKGMNGYKDYKAGFRREQTIASEKAGGAHGPLRASAHIRVSARFDYQPDICKDYKEAGYCGYGDSCKFMHDRGDYKFGWQLEKEWDEAEKARKMRLLAAASGEDADEEGDNVTSDEDDDDSLPFVCFICNKPFVDPVVTKCKHYFCEHCALKHHAKNKKCFVCNQPTLGTFNVAHEIHKKTAEDNK
ncbi:zinc finger CCCH domain-containing protein 51-like [Lotus japonicus]|uniref:zinc finger CCCH domain-containing protein 51-like n=1 Tax=Lotus japonicus TaxID=34305 RepID=UPI00258A6983|nr:zinc finger CCCH domain-containing protein 51-like [Lotus japonicus]